MGIENIDRALFSGWFVGVIVFIKEFFFADINAFISIVMIALAAIGYLIGDKIFTREKRWKSAKN